MKAILIFTLICSFLASPLYGSPCSRAVRAAGKMAQARDRRLYSPARLAYFQAIQMRESVEVEIGIHAIERFDAFVAEHGATYDLYARHFADFLLGIRDYREFYADPLGLVPGSYPEYPEVDVSEVDVFEVDVIDFDMTHLPQVNLNSPPLPPRLATPDLSGLDRFVREHTDVGPVFQEFYETAMENGGGMKGKANAFYEILIQYHLDKKLRQSQTPDSRARATRLAQRTHPIDEVLLFYSPSEEQQELWAEKLKEPRWKNVPRVVYVHRQTEGDWIRNDAFREQIDLVRLELSRPGAQPVACQVKNLLLVGDFWDAEIVGGSLREWRNHLVKNLTPLKVTIVDFDFGTSDAEVADGFMSGWSPNGELFDEEPPPLLVLFEDPG